MSFFDWNHDGKKDIWDTLYEYEMYRRFSDAWDESHRSSSYTPTISQERNEWLEDSDEVTDEEWRLTAEDGFDFDLDPDDYETEEEYEEALNEAKYGWRDTIDMDSRTSLSPDDYESLEDYNNALNALSDNIQGISETPLIINIGLSPEVSKGIKPENYPNKRRFQAAQALAEDYFGFDSYRKPAKFINESADKIIAANYLSYIYGFLFAQAIKDNFDLPCSLPDEDEKREMDFYEILVKIAKKDIPLSLKIWDWCLQQFGPFVQYDETAARQLSKYVFDHLYCFSKIEVFKHALVNYLNENYAFCKTVMSLCDEYYYNLSELIAISISKKYYDTANILFRIALNKASNHWKDINCLTDEIIMYCCSGNDLIDIEYFRDNLFPAIKAISNGMVRDEIPEFEKTMEDFIREIEETNSAYAFTRRNAWRKTVPSGKKYGLKPIDYDSEQEYLEALEEEKYGWRKWYKNQNTFGLNPMDYETCDEFEDALFFKEEELREIEEQKKDILQRNKEERERKAIAKKVKELEKKIQKEKENLLTDKTIYTYYGVLIPQATRPLSYISNDSSIKIGDSVMVPFGPQNKETEGTVVSIGQYTRLAVPYPVERVKKIIKKL